MSVVLVVMTLNDCSLGLYSLDAVITGNYRSQILMDIENMLATSHESDDDDDDDVMQRGMVH